MTGGTIAAGSTPFQTSLRALFAVLEDARAALDDGAYAVFVDVACIKIAREAARLARWEDAA